MKMPGLVPILVFGVAAALVIPWTFFLEYLKRDNPQLSTSFVVQLLPVWIALVAYGLIKGKKRKKDP